MNSRRGTDNKTGSIGGIKTLELARVYENQEYKEDAHKIYAALDAENSTHDTRAGMQRTQSSSTLPGETISAEITPLQTHEEIPDKKEISSEEKVMALIEEFCILLMQNHHFNTCRKFKFPMS